MLRIKFDVPRWHVFLHRDARGLDRVERDDPPPRQLEDELFDRLYAGGSEALPEGERNPELAAWAEKLHGICDQLPAFERLSQECAGDADAAGAAVETLMDELKPYMRDEPDQVDSPALRKVLNGGCEKASGVVSDRREAGEALGQVAFGKIAGTGSMTGSTEPHTASRELATRLQRDERLRRIALLAGKFKRIAAQKQRAKTKHGADEIADVEVGGDLGRVLPAEMARLARSATRLAFLRDLGERQVLQYRLTGSDSLGKGPLIACLDKSGSMNGPPDIWSTAVALALLDVAQRQRRPFALLGFDAQVKSEHVVMPGEPLPEDALFVSCLGGTNIGRVLMRGLEIVREHPGALKKADLVLITDGQSDTMAASMFRQAAAELGVTTLGVGIGVEKEDLEPWCDEAHGVTRLDDVGEGVAEGLFGGV